MTSMTALSASCETSSAASRTLDGAARRGDPERRPEALAREAEPLDRGAKHGVDEHDPACGRQDATRRIDQPVGESSGRVQGGQGGQRVEQIAERDVHTWHDSSLV